MFQIRTNSNSLTAACLEIWEISEFSDVSDKEKIVSWLLLEDHNLLQENNEQNFGECLNRFGSICLLSISLLKINLFNKVQVPPLRRQHISEVTVKASADQYSDVTCLQSKINSFLSYNDFDFTLKACVD